MPAYYKNKSIQTNGAEKPPKPSLRLRACRQPSNTPIAWADPTHHHKRQFGRFTHLHNYVRSRHWLQWDAPYPHPPKLPLPVGQSTIPNTCLILGPSQPKNPNGIHIQLAVFPQSTGESDRQTDQQMVQATKPVPKPAHALLMIATRLKTNKHTVTSRFLARLPRHFVSVQNRAGVSNSSKGNC